MDAKRREWAIADVKRISGRAKKKMFNIKKNGKN
jgi:hypothetical protein